MEPGTSREMPQEQTRGSQLPRLHLLESGRLRATGRPPKHQRSRRSAHPEDRVPRQRTRAVRAKLRHLGKETWLFTLSGYSLTHGLATPRAPLHFAPRIGSQVFGSGAAFFFFFLLLAPRLALLQLTCPLRVPPLSLLPPPSPRRLCSGFIL